MKKIISFLITVSLILSSFFAVIPSAEASTPSGELKINSASLAFGSKVFLLIAVDYSALYSDYNTAKAKITVSVSDKNGLVAELTPDDSVKGTDGFPDGSVGFKLTSLGAKNMADQLTIQAYNNGVASGDPVTYSILEYAVKVKSESDSPALKYALDAMLELGAEAQRAFNYAGDYPLYDEEGYIDYGMLVVYGASARKTFAPVGTQVTPKTDLAAPLLYTLSYDRIENNAITVKDGVQKAFYISADDKTGFFFDANSISGDTIYDNEKKAMSAAKNAPIDMGTEIYCNLQLNAVAAGENSVVKFVDLNGERVLEIEADKGYALTIGSSTATTESLIGVLGDSRYFTLTLTVGLKGSSVLATYFRLRDTSGYPNILNLSEGKISSTTSGETITTLASEELSTVHAVFDRTNKTTSYYVDGICVSEESWNNAVNTVLTGTKGSRLFLYGGSNNTGSRAGYIQKIIVTKGNIFD